jgi:cell division protein FtsW
MSAVGTIESEQAAGAGATTGWFPGLSTRLTALFWALACLGTVMVASAAIGSADGPAEVRRVLVQRAAWMGVALVAFLLGRYIPYRLWRRHQLAVIILTVGILVAVLIPGIGTMINGARRWIRLGPWIGFQPSAFAKVGVIIWCAAYVERNAERMHRFVPGFLVPFGVAGSVSVLVLLEPDFGTAALIGVIAGLLIVAFGSRLLYVMLAGMAMLPVVYHLVLGTPYRRERIMSFLHPWEDPLGSGYQLIQSMISVGSGGLMGRGLGLGVQKLGFLPDAPSDFIFALVSEELGFIGAGAVVLLFLLIVWEGLRVALRAEDRFGAALAFGIAALFGIQGAIHMGVVTGSLPTTGMTLPLISAGGSSLFVGMAAAGLLVNVAARAESPGGEEPTPWYKDTPFYEEWLHARVLDPLQRRFPGIRP